MFTEERYKYILNLLDKNGKVLVKELSQEFNISESMIRKDLQALEKQNLLKRTYGGAINIKHTIANIESFHTRIEKDTDLKQITAKKAFNLVADKDTIFLDASSISYLIAKYMVENDKEATIITNMLQIASLIPENSKTKFIFISGEYNSVVGGNIGSLSIEQTKRYRCSKAFIGCTGIDLKDGMAITALSDDAILKNSVMNISQEVYLVMLNSKFKANGNFTFAGIGEFTGVITESIPDKTIIGKLENFKVNLI